MGKWTVMEMMIVASVVESMHRRKSNTCLVLEIKHARGFLALKGFLMAWYRNKTCCDPTPSECSLLHTEEENLLHRVS